MFSDEREFRTLAIHLDSKVGLDFNLVLAMDNSQGLLQLITALCIVVDDDTECPINEVASQQVAALPSKLVELLIKGHVVLIS